MRVGCRRTLIYVTQAVGDYAGAVAIDRHRDAWAGDQLQEKEPSRGEWAGPGEDGVAA